MRKFKLSAAAHASACQLQRNKGLTQASESRGSYARLAGVLVLVALAAGCASLPKGEKTVMGNAGSAQGSWRAKALMKNLKTSKSVTLDLDMVAQEPDRLRIEALGPFSTHVASIAAKGDDVRIALTREKKFITTRADRWALSRIVPVRVAPSDLLAILFDRPLDANNSGWKCDHASQPAWICQSGTATVARNADQEGRRNFVFTAPDSEMDLVITEAKADVPPGESAYELAPPAGYKIEAHSR